MMILKIIHVILLASVKYFFTFPYAMIIGLDYKQALFAVLAGGIGGVVFFYYLSKPLFRYSGILFRNICKLSPPVYKMWYKKICDKHKHRPKAKIFSRKSRIIAKIKSTYGLWGIIITTPFFLTIPVGAFLASKYYSHHKYIVGYLILSVIGWAILLSVLIHLFPNIFF